MYVVFQRLLGPWGKMPILIRDDDTNFFTKSSMLESVYSKAWEEGFKVSLAVVPFQRAINDICVPPSVRDMDSHFPILENKPLVHYLKNKIQIGAIEILQHGFSHYIGKDGRGEYGNELDKSQDIELGRNMLREALDVNAIFFVPPGEDISKKNLMALIRMGLVPIQRQTLFDNYMRNPFVPSYLKHLATKLLAKYKNKDNNENGNLGVQLVKPVLISVRTHSIS